MHLKPLLVLLPMLIIMPASAAQTEAYPSTYNALPSEATLITHATILTGTGKRLDNANLLISGGKIVFVGDGDVPGKVTTIDATGRWVTPGLIDIQSKLGVYPSPGVDANSYCN
jgi:imidazolonepropionase-like amidohydrolase